MSRHYEITAIIYSKRKEILSIGKNSYVKTHPVQAKYAKKVGEPNKVYLHAEIHAILRCKDLSKAHSIKIFRFLDDGTPANAKPCKVCMEAINAAGIKFIEHT